MKTSNPRFAYCLLVLLCAASTVIADQSTGHKGKRQKTMQQVIAAACEKDPYGPKCIGNLDAYNNYERSYRDRYWYNNGHYCGSYVCNDGWSEEWRH